MKIVTLSAKNQITLPKAMISLLDLQPKEKLIIDYKEEELIIRPLGSSIVERTAGSLTNHVSSAKRGKKFSDILKDTKKITAKKLSRGS